MHHAPEYISTVHKNIEKMNNSNNLNIVEVPVITLSRYRYYRINIYMSKMITSKFMFDHFFYGDSLNYWEKLDIYVQ